MAYIGNSPEGDAQVNKYEYTATSGQTNFPAVYDQRVDVYLNGVLLSGTDYTATNGTEVVLGTGATLNDIVQIDAFQQVQTKLEGIKFSAEHTATSGQTDFAATYTPGYLDVFLNGVRLDAADYTATNGTTVVLATGATLNDIVYIQAFQTFEVGDAVTKTDSTGSAVLPVGTTAQRDGTPGTGYLRFNTTDGGFEGYNGTSWGAVGGGATGGGSDDAFYENTTTITADYTITTGKNAMTAGPVTVNSGVVVTVPSGSVWHIL